MTSRQVGTKDGSAQARAVECPSLELWRELKATEQVLNSTPDDTPALQADFHEAQARFLYAQDTSLQGILLKLLMIDETEDLKGYLDDSPNLLWPRTLFQLIHDLKALGLEPPRT